MMNIDRDQILADAVKQTGNNNLFMPNTDNIKELCEEYEKTLLTIDELCDKIDPESTPFVSKYKARDIIDEIVKRLEATYTVSILEGKKDVARIMDSYVANLRVKLGIICWDVEEPHNCQIELDLAAEFLCPRYVKQITDLTKYEENLTSEDGINNVDDESKVNEIQNYEENFVEPPYPKDDNGSSVELAINQMKCLNMLGILWAGRGYKGRAFYYLQAVKSIYERTEPKTVEIENIYTHNLFYLAQAYVHIGNARKSSYFCRETLQRQCNTVWTNPREALDWAKNCAGLSDFYKSVGEYVKCSLALASTDYALNTCAKLLDNNNDEEKNGDIFDLLHEVRIDLYRRWVIFDVNILKRAYERQCLKEHLMYLGEEWMPDAPTSEEDLGDLKMVPNNLEIIPMLTSSSNLPPLPPDDTISSDVLIPKREFFKGLPVTETSYIHEGDIETFEVARLVFLRGMANAENAKKHYVLDGFVSDHVNLLQNQSKMYHYLSVFEADKKRKLAMEQRRLDILLPIISAINKNAFDALHKQLSYELGECYLSAIENKIDKLRDSNGEVEVRKLKKADIIKVNSYVKGALAMFAHYTYLFAKSDDRNKYSKNSPFEELSLEELLSAVCLDPDESLISESEMRLFLNAMFLSCRAMQKTIPLKESTNHQRASYLICSLKLYAWLVDKGKTICQRKNLNIDDIFRSEIEVCKNMIELLPAKIDRIIYKGENGLSI